jgi:bacterial/archaeal transporter family protein
MVISHCIQVSITLVLFDILNFMNWLTLIFISVLLASVASILQRVLMKSEKSEPYSYAIVFHFLLGFLNLIFAIVSGSHLSLFNENFLFLLLASILWGGCSIFLFKSLQLIEASEKTMLSSLNVVFTIIASIIFLHEIFTGKKILGTALILISTLLIVNLKNGFKLNKGVIYVLITALFAGLAVVVDSINVQTYDVIGYNTFQNFLTGFFILAFAPKALKNWRHFIQPEFLIKMLPLGIFSATQTILYLTALTQPGHTAQISVVRQSSTIVTVLLAFIFLKERNNVGRKVVAAVLVTIGVILLK